MANGEAGTVGAPLGSTVNKAEVDVVSHRNDDVDAISIHSVSFWYGRGEKRRLILDDIAFNVRNGEIFCLVGPSGCGKSTLLRLIAGLEGSFSGTIERSGRVDTVSSSSVGSVGFVFQSPCLLNWRTVRQNINIVLKPLHLKKDEAAARIEKYLRIVGLGDQESNYPLKLSGGMQQRVAFARALAIESDILLVDEAFSGLDELTARNLRKDFVAIVHAIGQAVIFVTHNVTEAVMLGDRVGVLSTGPARLIRVHDITMPRPRDPESNEAKEFIELILADLGVSKQ